MSIFNEFYQALSATIDIYEAKKISQGKSVSERRRGDVIKLKKILSESENKNNRHPLLLRKAILDFVENLERHPLAKLFPGLFVSDLGQTIQEVLDDPDYSNLMLVAKEQMEAKGRQQRILNYLHSAEAADSAETIEILGESIERLEQSLELSENKYIDLNKKYILLQRENTQLKERITELENPTQSSQSEQEQEKSRYTKSGVFA